MAIAGIVLDVNKWLDYPKLGTLMYLAMGWVSLFAAKPLLSTGTWFALAYEWWFALHHRGYFLHGREIEVQPFHLAFVCCWRYQLSFFRGFVVCCRVNFRDRLLVVGGCFAHLPRIKKPKQIIDLGA